MKRPQTISRAKPMHTAVYMEVYSSNRVIYRVTAGAVASHGKTRPAYGVILEDMRTGEIRTLPDFSESLERTIAFANDLVRRETPPSGLYDVALEYLSASVPQMEQKPAETPASKKIRFYV